MEENIDFSLFLYSRQLEWTEGMQTTLRLVFLHLRLYEYLKFFRPSLLSIGIMLYEIFVFQFQKWNFSYDFENFL